MSRNAGQTDGLLSNPDDHGHFVQFYEADDQLLAQNVGEYLGEGLQRGESAVIIAAADHNECFARQLRYVGIDVDRAIGNGQLQILDAEQAMARFMVDRWPNRTKFQNTIGTIVRSARQRRGGLRAYGEMVGILWRAGHYSAAIQLEEFWNELLASVQFSLFCAYPIDVFDSEFQTDSIYALLCDHTHVIPAGENGRLESAVTQAMHEILGDKRPGAGSERAHPRDWAAIPAAEAQILRLRKAAPDSADEVLARARELYRSVLP